MSHRTRTWTDRLATGLGVVLLLGLAGCYATAGRGAYYSTGYAPAPAQTVYYAPAQAQVQVQTPGVYYEQPAQQPVYYVQPAQQPPVYYVQPAPQPPVYVQPQPTTVYFHGGRGHHRRQRPVVIQQGDGTPNRVEVQGTVPARGTVHVR